MPFNGCKLAFAKDRVGELNPDRWCSLLNNGDSCPLSYPKPWPMTHDQAGFFLSPAPLRGKQPYRSSDSRL